MPAHNKFRAAIELLQRSRDQIVEQMADEILDRSDELIESSYLFQEFLEGQGTRLHFLTLMMSQLEQAADALDERRAAEAVQQSRSRSKRSSPRAPRAAKKLAQATSREPEGNPDES